MDAWWMHGGCIDGCMVGARLIFLKDKDLVELFEKIIDCRPTVEWIHGRLRDEWG